jgi:hypothetical protein
MTSNGQHQPHQKPRFSMTADIAEQIKSIASRLRPCCEEYNITTTVSGLELQNQRVFEIKRGGIIQPVEIAQMYDIPGVALRDINHVLKIRKFYYANGIIGVHDYLTQFPGYEATMCGQYPSLWKDGTYIGVEEGTQLPIDPEWLRKMEAIDKMQSQINQQ